MQTNLVNNCQTF